MFALTTELDYIYSINNEQRGITMYKITDIKGNTLCYQGGESDEQALRIARIFYGHKTAVTATRV